MRKLLVLLALLFASPAWGAIVLEVETDSDAAAIDVTDQPTGTVPITLTAKSNGALFVGVCTTRWNATTAADNNIGTTPTDGGASGVTADGNAMTLVTNSFVGYDDSSYDPSCEWWGRALGTTSAGSIDVVVTYRTQSTRPASIVAYFLSGVDQSTLTEAVETGGTIATSITDSITTTSENAYLLQVNSGKGASTPITPDNSQTETLDIDITATETYWYWAGYKDAGASGAETMGVSSIASDNSVQSVIAVKPAATTQIKSVNGVAQAQIKSVNGVAIAQIKTVEGVSNV